MIPFKVKAEDLPKMLTDFYSKRPLLPKNFFYDNQVGEVQGIYVPFWLYDGTIVGRARYDGIDTSYSREGDYDVTTPSAITAIVKVPCSSTTCLLTPPLVLTTT